MVFTSKQVIRVVFVLGGGAVALVGLSCRGSQTTPSVKSEAPAEVRIVVAAISAMSRTLDLTGSVVPVRDAGLASPAEGPVISLRVREGDFARAGDTLLMIGRQEGISAQIVSLREDVRKEEVNLGRATRLAEIDGYSKEQLDQAKANYERASALLVKAQESARDYSIIAPWDGMIRRVRVEVGDYITPREPLVDMYDPSSLVIRVAVPERHAGMLQRNAPVIATLDAYPDSVFHAIVTRVYPYLDERMRTRTIEIQLESAVDLLPGMFARVKLRSGTVESTVVIPAGALTVTPEAMTIVYVVSGGKAARRTVKTGLEESDRVQIIEGIRPGDSLIVSGIARLKDGGIVRVIGSTSQKADSLSTAVDEAGRVVPGRSQGGGR